MQDDDERHPAPQVEDERLTTERAQMGVETERAEVDVAKDADGGWRSKFHLVGAGAQERILRLFGIVGLTAGPQWVLQLGPVLPWWVYPSVAVTQVLAIWRLARKPKAS